jgi:hypothetical protein
MENQSLQISIGTHWAEYRTLSELDHDHGRNFGSTDDDDNSY